MADPRDHLRVTGVTEARRFRSTLSVRRTAPPDRNRTTHGGRLSRQLRALARVEERLAEQRAQMQLPTNLGTSLTLELRPAGLLDLATIEWRREGIEVLNSRVIEDREYVTVFVPPGGLRAFQKRVEEYLEQETKKGNPKNAGLINLIESFREAAFIEFWTDVTRPPDPQGPPQWFQLWLRLDQSPDQTWTRFSEEAARWPIEIEDRYLVFPGRVVVAVRATRAVLEQAIGLLDLIAEIRAVGATAEFFLKDLTPANQVEWVRNLEARLQLRPPTEANYVTLFDTGVNPGHPLLQGGIDAADLHAFDAAWHVTDHFGHGTEMAGLSLLGNLTGPLASSEPHAIPHRLESVKILPPMGQNAPHLYGSIMYEAAGLVEQAHPERRRAFAMMTTETGGSRGLPTEWSASLDALAYGMPSHDDVAGEEGDEVDLTPRLFIVATGNVPWPQWFEYPAVNDTSPVESPAQAWNVLSVGACTQLTDLDATTYPEWTPIAPLGALSPSSSTSLTWNSAWPFKPDVVAEGGNGCLAPGNNIIVGPESLRVLTTSHEPLIALFAESGDTSGATAEVARLAAHLDARYPNHWPETQRALIAHGAQYTQAMRASVPIPARKRDFEVLLRRFGYGAITSRALFSTAQRPTLILQERITPYRRHGNDISLNDINMHALPWPAAELSALGGLDVELRVTLSYFIEPNPSRRGWHSKFRYQSHGLRFDVKAATETDDRFNQRINLIERLAAAGEEGPESMPNPDRDGWLLGSQLRSRGSLHSDVWRGTAADLAGKSHIAVFPVGGWWKDWKGAPRPDRSVRYALIVSIEIPEATDVDIYTAIANQIAVPVAVEITL